VVKPSSVTGASAGGWSGASETGLGGAAGGVAGFSVPTVGCTTIETLAKAGGRVLAIEAGETILLDQEQTGALAARLGICIVALDEQSA
jgi:hypothetical protein